MALKGINLSPRREKQWLTKHYKNLIILFLNITLSIIIAILILFFTRPLEKGYIQYKSELNSIKNNIQKTEQQILQLKTNNTLNNSIYLENNDVTDFIQYLTQFPTAGNIELSQLYYDKAPKIRISGKLSNRKDFEKIIQQLKQNNTLYKIENFQTTDNNSFEFSIGITLQGNKNEKLD